MSSRRALLESLLLSRLPAEFQEVEYIESSGTQYIDSGYANISNNQKIIAKFYNNIAGGSLFGSQQGSNRSGIFWQSVNNLQFGIGLQTAGTMIGQCSYQEIHTIEYESSLNTYSVSIDGTYLKENASYSGSNITGKNIYIFASNYQNSLENIFKGKVYCFRIYDNSVLVRNFVPCYRKSDNEIGLYDLVNGVFYTNAGTGTFTKGADV